MCYSVLDAVLADLNRTRQGIARFLGVDGRGTLEAVVQDGVGILLSTPLLQLEHKLDRAHEVLAVLGARLPAIGRAVDERKVNATTPADAFPNMGAD